MEGLNSKNKNIKGGGSPSNSVKFAHDTKVLLQVQ